MSYYCREEGQHGGSAIYCRANTKCKVRNDLCSLSVSEVCEVAAIEIKLHSKLIVLSVYRAPNTEIRLFLETIEQILNKTLTEECEICLAGDFNINLRERSFDSSNFISLLNSYGLYPSTFEPTRVTNSTETCIDNILTNMTVFETCVVEHHISDHKCVILYFNNVVNQSAVSKVIRTFSDKNIELFKQKLNEENWQNVYECDSTNVNQQWNIFMNIFKPIFNNCFPEKRIRVNVNKNCKFYNDPEVMSCKSQLDILLVLSNCDPRYKSAYKQMKLRYNEILIKSRKNHYSSQLNKSTNKSKTTWNIIKSIKGCDSFNNKIDGDAQNFANTFNNYIVKNVLDSLSNLRSEHYNCNIPLNPKSLFLEPISPSEMFNVMTDLKSRNSSGYDSIPSRIIKLCRVQLCDPLLFIVNNSFLHGIFPDCLKESVVTPVYKKGDPKSVENYRPISLLPSFSKIFEMIMCKRLISFFNYCHLFSPTQHGYLKGRSIETAVHSFIQYILDSLEEKSLVIGIFLDLSKAFDSLDHEILIEKLERYGVRGSALLWIKSYLINRHQRVKVVDSSSEYLSDRLNIRIGIPQGSVLGPLLFIIYINDLNSLVQLDQALVNFADDSNFLVKSESFEQLTIQTNHLLSKIKSFMFQNKLILNESKTNYVIFTIPQQNQAIPTQISLESSIISPSTCVKFLGLQINKNLNWSDHLETLVGKLNRVTYTMRVLQSYVEESTVRTLYFSNFQSLLRYGIIFWGQDKEVRHVFVAQKRMLRTILKIPTKESCRTKFKNNNLLTVTGLYVYETLLFFFKNPHVFDGLRSKSSRVTNYNYPIHRLTLYEKGWFYSAIALFNKLPQSIKDINNFKPFKSKLYAYICDLEPYSLNELLSVTNC